MTGARSALIMSALFATIAPSSANAAKRGPVLALQGIFYLQRAKSCKEYREPSMRNTYTWKQGILKQLRPQWTNDASLSPQARCDVELGLYALLRLLPGEQANALWVLLIGYPFKLPQVAHWSEQERHMRQVLRYLLSHYKSYQGWRRAIERYSKLPARLRLYDVQQDGGITSHADKVSIGSNRERIYGQILSQNVPFARDTVHLAGAGRYLCVGGKLTSEVILPEDLVRACAARPSRGHDLQTKQRRPPFSVTFQ